MSWTILIPTLGQRADLFARLLTQLMPQVDEADGAVKVLAYWNNGELGLPTIRQTLVQAVDTQYLSFVDDDDLVVDDYVPTILEALSSSPDFVGFQVQCYTDGEPQGVAHHSLAHRRWGERPGGILVRDISHINPMRAAIAKRADFRRAAPGQPEDRIWVRQLRGKLKTEVVIDRIMYHYLWSPEVTAWQDRHRRRIVKTGWAPLQVDSPHFAYHPKSVREVANA